MEGQTFTQWDLVSIPGISVAVVAVVGSIKKMFPDWTKGKEPLLGLFFSYAIGVSAKLTIPGAFEKVHWIVFLIALLVAAAGAKLGHDYFVNDLVHKKPHKHAPNNPHKHAHKNK